VAVSGSPSLPWSFATERGDYRARLSAGYGATDSAGLSRDSRGHRYAASQPDAGGGPYYVVRPGDPPSGIAAQFGTSVRDLASANGIPDPDFISVGQKLYY
jgi:LysM repeat protein